MRFVMLLVAALMAVMLAAAVFVPNAVDASSNAICWSTGDPHYSTFTGYYYDMYGRKGDYVLAQSDDGALNVETRIAFRRKQFVLRGLNAGLFVRLDGVTLEYHGSTHIWLNRNKYTLNQIESSKTGVKLTKHVAFAKDSKGQFVLSSTKSGFTVGFTTAQLATHSQAGMSLLAKLEDPLKYFNVFVSAPPKYKGRMTGLCGTYADKDTDSKCLVAQHDCQQLGPYSSFHKKLPFFEHEAEKPAHFDSPKAKKQAKKACRKLKGAMRRACVADMQAVGHKSKTIAKMYRAASKTLKRVKKQAKKVKKVIKKRKLVKKTLKKLRKFAKRGNTAAMQKLMARMRGHGILGKVMHNLHNKVKHGLHKGKQLLAAFKAPAAHRQALAIPLKPRKQIFFRYAALPKPAAGAAAVARPVAVARPSIATIIRRAAGRGARTLGRRGRRGGRRGRGRRGHGRRRGRRGGRRGRGRKARRAAAVKKIRNGQCPCMCPARAPRRFLVAKCPRRGSHGRPRRHRRRRGSKYIDLLHLFDGMDFGQNLRCGSKCRAKYVRRLSKAVKIYRSVLKMF